MFGPSSIIITCADLAEVAAIMEGMEGQLTATLPKTLLDGPGTVLRRVDRRYEA